jgi:SAM-dependent methyltransferase
VSGTDVTGMRAAYEATGATWSQGPALVYDRYAELLVAHCHLRLAGRRIVDLGAGTGALSKALLAADAAAIAIDLAFGMLHIDRDARPPASVGDAAALPIATGSVDGVGMAFSLSHVPDPRVALHEITRVTRRGGVVLSASFAGANDHPAKSAVDRAAAAFGFEVPAWMTAFKTYNEPLVASLPALEDLALEAGLTDVVITETAVDVGMDSPEAMVAWRLGMAHLAPFLSSLDDVDRGEVAALALAELGPDPVPFRPNVLFFAAAVG